MKNPTVYTVVEVIPARRATKSEDVLTEDVLCSVFFDRRDADVDAAELRASHPNRTFKVLTHLS